MRSPSMRTDARRAGEPDPSMTFAFEIRMLERAGAGVDFGAQANTIAEMSAVAELRMGSDP